MKAGYIVGILLVLMFIIGAGCEQKATCPEGDVLIEGTCCLDSDENGVCDASQVITEEPKEQPAATEPEEEPVVITPQETETGYFWDNKKISVEGYICGNKTISVNLKNNLPNSVTLNKVKVGSAYAKGLPMIFRAGQTQDFDVMDPTLVKGMPIDDNLFIEYRDLVKKETVFLGPSELEGTC